MENIKLEKYYGSKQIGAAPMTRGEYNALRGWNPPPEEIAAEEGYLVSYPDSKNNVEGLPGYISWTPKKPFDEAYRRIDALTFSQALEALKQGLSVRRAGWVDSIVLSEDSGKKVICCVESPGIVYPTWWPDGEEIMAEDWEIVTPDTPEQTA